MLLCDVFTIFFINTKCKSSLRICLGICFVQKQSYGKKAKKITKNQIKNTSHKFLFDFSVNVFYQFHFKSAFLHKFFNFTVSLSLSLSFALRKVIFCLLCCICSVECKQAFYLCIENVYFDSRFYCHIYYVPAISISLKTNFFAFFSVHFSTMESRVFDRIERNSK